MVVDNMSSYFKYAWHRKINELNNFLRTNCENFHISHFIVVNVDENDKKKKK